ncbi:hypothetical protein Celgi_1598 [Cellulomonas gilvus ATCC 13127]|uniref:Uncharacterized protein n=1 Tax=Cellulomonas gilvus (strain ATCC 13127 / NRRL B-14078) TaxID=593907 RepID=F8A506_CELGA|nr:hypothetical protein Celgi_1598 [Cellulomonas gilvus ATCC 13127]
MRIRVARTALALLAAWTAVLATSVVLALMAPDPGSAFAAFFAVLALAAHLAALVWGWRHLPRPAAPAEPEEPPRDHVGLRPDAHPPRRW